MTELDKQGFIAHIEALLKEQIKEMGENPEEIEAHEYAAQMRCEVQSDGAMVYLWREMPILRMIPEKKRMVKYIGVCLPQTIEAWNNCISLKN